MSFIRNGWYCAGFSRDITHQLMGRTFLDEPVLLFRKEDGHVTALSDVCPHRFAPLHQGRLEGDTVQCPYHGLCFDAAGQCVRNPHGSRRIPPRSDLRSYPLVERDGVAWIWMGEPTLADPTNIVDLELIDAEIHAPISGYMKMEADYRLVIDNLLDLNHAPYLHGGSLSPVGQTRETTAERGTNSAASIYLMRSVQTPESQRLWFDAPTGDYHVSMHWTAPGTLRQRIAMTATGQPPEAGAVTRGAHLLTPETATTTHYFWMMSRNRHAGDATLDARLKAIIENAFLTEDGPMIAACQRNMRGRDFTALRPVFLETDVAPGHARAVLKRLAADEAQAAAAMPIETVTL